MIKGKPGHIYEYMISEMEYSKVFIPNFEYLNKAEVPGFTFIKTIPIGNKHGHILHGWGRYYLCVRADDRVSFEERYAQPLGYSRETLDELMSFADTIGQKKKKQNTKQVADTHFSEKPVLDPKLPWKVRAEGLKLINLRTNQVVNLNQSKRGLERLLKMTPYTLWLVAECGYKVRDWCVMTKRLDGKPWPTTTSEFLASSPTS